MQNTIKKFASVCIFTWIVSLTVLVVLFAFPKMIIGQDAKLIQNATSDNYETGKSLTDSEKELIFIIRKSDSLSKSDKQFALVYLERNVDALSLTKVNNEVLAEYYHVYGKFLVENEKFDISLINLNRSLKLKKKVYGDNDSRLAKTYNYIGIAKFRMHDYEEALGNYSKSVEILISNSFYGRDLFDAYLNIGIVKANLGNFDDAYVYFNDASNIIKQGPAADSLVIANFYMNYGLLATLMGKMELAIEYFEISEVYYTNLLGNQNLNLAYLNLNKGVNTYTNLNYNLSSLYHKKAVELFITNNKIGSGLIKSLNNLCAISRELGDLQTSLDYGYLALSYKPPKEMKLLVISNLIKSFEVLKDYVTAEEYFQKALDIVDNQDFNPRRKFDIYLLYANFLLSNKEYTKSLGFYKKALDIEGEINGYKTPKYAFVISRMGFYYLEVEPTSNKALQYFNRSIDIWKSHLKDERNGVSKDFHDTRFVNAYRGKSKALIVNYENTGEVENLFESLDNYKWLLEQLERISRSLQKENQKIVREQLYPIYNEAIELSYKLYKISSNNYYQKMAFSFSEKSKSAMLLSSMQNMNALKTSDLPKKLLKLDHNLNEEINAVKKQLFEEKQKANPKRKRVSFFESRLVDLLDSHDSLVRFLEKDYPKYYSLKYDLSIIGFNDLSRKLSNEEALIEYQLFDTSLYIFTIRNKRLFTDKVIVDSSFYNSLNYFINLKNEDLSTQTRDDYNNFINHSNNLYTFLIQPVSGYIKEKKLIIVPSGLLGYLPFEVLVNPRGKTKELEYKELDFLIKEFPISYSYSSTLRFSPYFNKSTYKAKLNILYMSPEYSAYKTIGFADNKPKFANLPYARKEVVGLQTEFGGKAYVGVEAVKSKFLSIAPNYDILHLAMHTIINDSLPMYSRLIFSPEGKIAENGFLNTSEIYGLNLRASMVTLSACNTAAGVLQKGEGIMSLARGFVYAGVPSVVMTLWEVQDESGLMIMKAFYSYLSKGLAKDKAMQLAKLDMLKSANMIKSHPNFWAAYIVTGDTSQLNITDEKDDLWFLVLLVIVLLITFNLYRRTVKNESYLD